MNTDWDYTGLADAYLKRPSYADEAVDAMLRLTGCRAGAVCDIGAGAAHLTCMLARRGCRVVAVEPNDAMRAHGIERTRRWNTVHWTEAVGEATGQPAAAFDLVTFGSSFNVCDRSQALREAARILKREGWLACLWNHRRLDDPLQSRIEAIIHDVLPGYSYGARHEDQTPLIASSGLFRSTVRLFVDMTHNQSIADCVSAWRSHATLARQAGERFEEIVRLIERALHGAGSDPLLVPYTTVVTLAQRR